MQQGPLPCKFAIACGDGVTLNDPGDADTGANDLQNFPVINSVTSGPSWVTIEGALDSTPNTNFTLQFFYNNLFYSTGSTCNPSGYGEGENFLGSANVATDSGGSTTLITTYPVGLQAMWSVTSTATDPNGNTSEFSACEEFVPPPVCRTLAVSVNPQGSGSVSADPTPNCNNGTQYIDGTVVELTAMPTSGHVFANWGGDATGTASQINVAMDADKSVTANFSQLCYTLTTGVNPGGGGSVGTSPAPNCNGGTQYSLNSVVMLTALSNGGFIFANWSGDASGSSNPINIFIDADRNVTANFSQLCYTLTLLPSQGDGSVSVDPSPNCNGGTQYTPGTVVELTAYAGGDYTFKNWSGDASGTDNPTNITMDGDRSVMANFDRACCDADIPYHERGPADVELPEKTTPRPPSEPPTP